MAHSDHFLPLYDQKGILYSVMLSAEFWEKYKHRLEPMVTTLLNDMEPEAVIHVEPLHEWEEFSQYWDFKYPLTPHVECGNCGNKTDDWTTDFTKPFRLKSAQLGGLVVFACNKCGATVRKKHFKDHFCFEFTPSCCKK